MRMLFVAAVAGALLAGGCSSTQKTSGQGMVSVVAQNVVRLAGREAVSDLDVKEVNNRKTFVKVTGFVDEFSRGYVENLIRSQVEAQGGKLVSQDNADTFVEVAVNAAGNDFGGSGYVLGKSSRSEGTVDLTITVREAETGERISQQQIIGHAKYQQGTFLGISGSGAYFILKGDDWQIVEDPAYYN